MISLFGRTLRWFRRRQEPFAVTGVFFNRKRDDCGEHHPVYFFFISIAERTYMKEGIAALQVNRPELLINPSNATLLTIRNYVDKMKLRTSTVWLYNPKTKSWTYHNIHVIEG